MSVVSLRLSPSSTEEGPCTLSRILPSTTSFQADCHLSRRSRTLKRSLSRPNCSTAISDFRSTKLRCRMERLSSSTYKIDSYAVGVFCFVLFFLSVFHPQITALPTNIIMCDYSPHRLVLAHLNSCEGDPTIGLIEPSKAPLPNSVYQGNAGSGSSSSSNLQTSGSEHVTGWASTSSSFSSTGTSSFDSIPEQPSSLNLASLPLSGSPENERRQSSSLASRYQPLSEGPPYPSSDSQHGQSLPLKISSSSFGGAFTNQRGECCPFCSAFLCQLIEADLLLCTSLAPSGPFPSSSSSSSLGRRPIRPRLESMQSEPSAGSSSPIYNPYPLSRLSMSSSSQSLNSRRHSRNHSVADSANFYTNSLLARDDLEPSMLDSGDRSRTNLTLARSLAQAAGESSDWTEGWNVVPPPRDVERPLAPGMTQGWASPSESDRVFAAQPVRKGSLDPKPSVRDYRLGSMPETSQLQAQMASSHLSSTYEEFSPDSSPYHGPPSSFLPHSSGSSLLPPPISHDYRHSEPTSYGQSTRITGIPILNRNYSFPPTAASSSTPTASGFPEIAPYEFSPSFSSLDDPAQSAMLSSTGGGRSPGGVVRSQQNPALQRASLHPSQHYHAHDTSYLSNQQPISPHTHTIDFDSNSGSSEYYHHDPTSTTSSSTSRPSTGLLYERPNEPTDHPQQQQQQQLHHSLVDTHESYQQTYPSSSSYSTNHHTTSTSNHSPISSYPHSPSTLHQQLPPQYHQQHMSSQQPPSQSHSSYHPRDHSQHHDHHQHYHHHSMTTGSESSTLLRPRMTSGVASSSTKQFAYTVPNSHPRSSSLFSSSMDSTVLDDGGGGGGGGRAGGKLEREDTFGETRYGLDQHHHHQHGGHDGKPEASWTTWGGQHA